MPSISSQKPTPFDNRLGDFLSSLNDTCSLDDAWQTSVNFMRGLGASHVGISAYSQETKPTLMWTTPSWVEDMYLSEVYPDHCPAVEHCFESATPYFGGLELENQNQSLRPSRRHLLEEQSNIEIRSGMSVSINTHFTKDKGVFNFDTNLRACEFGDFYREHGTTIHLAGIIAFEQIRSLMNAEEAKEFHLTPRERECLLWLSRGLRNDRIANRLGLRPVTVEFHLANARRKLGAITREQALVIAVHKGLIEP